MRNVASCSLTCGSQNYMYTVFGTSIVTPALASLGLMFWVKSDLKPLIWVPCVTRNAGKFRYTIRDLRQNYHKSEDSLTEFKVVLSLTYVNILVVMLSIIWIKMSNYYTIKVIIMKLALDSDSGGRAFFGIVLQPLACWDCGFESRRGNGCLSPVHAVCCAGRGLCDGPIPRRGEFYRERAFVCVTERDQVKQ